jgi:hypothetical protein
VSDLAHAPVWGLCAARSEHVERSLRLVDVDRLEQAREVLARGLSASREPEWRCAVMFWLAARLVRGRGRAERRRASSRLESRRDGADHGGTGELVRRWRNTW